MLLLMIQPQFDQCSGLLIWNVEVPQHCFIHVRAIGVNFLKARARHQPTRAAIWMRSELFVIGIEELSITWIKGLIAADMFVQDECLKEPRRVCQVPFTG